MAKVDYEALLRLTATDQTGAAFAAATQRMRAFERESQRANAAGLATYNPRRQFVGFSGSTFAAAGAAVSRFRMQMGQAVAVFEGARFLKNDYVGGAAFVRRMNELQQVMGASDEQMKRAVPVYRQIAQDLALPVDQIIRGAEEFAKIGGRTSDQILAILPTVAAAARASGSDVQDFAQMTNGLMSQMKISGDQLPRVFDELITAGRNGQAEIKEFAHTFPMLTAAAARLGYTGVEGVERLAAVLEVVRNDTSNTDEAAQHLSETMRKVFSEQTDKAFAQHGFPNLQRRLLQVRAEGGDVLAYTADIVRHLQEKGVSLEELFGNDAQVIQTWTSLIQRYGEVRQRMDQMKQAADVTNQALRKLLNDPQADIDRLSNKFIELKQKIYESLYVAGAPAWIHGAIEAIDDLEHLMVAIGALKGGRFGKFFEEFNQTRFAKDMKHPLGYDEPNASGSPTDRQERSDELAGRRRGLEGSTGAGAGRNPVTQMPPTVGPSNDAGWEYQQRRERRPAYPAGSGYQYVPPGTPYYPFSGRPDAPTSPNRPPFTPTPGPHTTGSAMGLGTEPGSGMHDLAASMRALKDTMERHYEAPVPPSSSGRSPSGVFIGTPEEMDRMQQWEREHPRPVPPPPPMQGREYPDASTPDVGGGGWGYQKQSYRTRRGYGIPGITDATYHPAERATAEDLSRNLERTDDALRGLTDELRLQRGGGGVGGGGGGGDFGGAAGGGFNPDYAGGGFEQSAPPAPASPAGGARAAAGGPLDVPVAADAGGGPSGPGNAPGAPDNLGRHLGGRGSKNRMANFRAKAGDVMANLQRDVPGYSREDYAAALGNLGHESAGFTAYQEGNPRSGRGGAGWAQWTGPRRRQFEAWAAKRGLDPRDPATSYGYLTSPSGEGREFRKALDAAHRRQGLGNKVQAFEQSYERAGVKAYGSRTQYAEAALDARPTEDVASAGAGAKTADASGAMGQAQAIRKEIEKPIKMKVEAPQLPSAQVKQVRRASIRRQVAREVREARHHSFADIGAA